MRLSGRSRGLVTVSWWTAMLTHNLTSVSHNTEIRCYSLHTGFHLNSCFCEHYVCGSQTAAPCALQPNSRVLLPARPASFSPRFVPKCWRRRRFPCAVWPNLDLTPRDTGLFLLPCSNTSFSGKLAADDGD